MADEFVPVTGADLPDANCATEIELPDPGPSFSMVRECRGGTIHVIGYSITEGADPVEISAVDTGERCDRDVIDFDSEFYCDVETGTIWEVLITFTNGVETGRVASDTGVSCVADTPLDFEKSRECRNGFVYVVTCAFDADGVKTEISAVDTGESCGEPDFAPECYEIVEWRNWVDNHPNADRPPGPPVRPGRSYEIVSCWSDGGEHTAVQPAAPAGDWGATNDNLAVSINAGCPSQDWVGPSGAPGDQNPRGADGDPNTPYGAYAHANICAGDKVVVKATAYQLDANGDRVRDANGNLVPIPLANGVIVTKTRVWLCKVKGEPVVYETDDGTPFVPTPEQLKCMVPCGTAPEAPNSLAQECSFTAPVEVCEFSDPNTQVAGPLLLTWRLCGSNPPTEFVYTEDADGNAVEHVKADVTNYFGDCATGDEVEPPQPGECTEATLIKCPDVPGLIAHAIGGLPAGGEFQISEGGITWTICGSDYLIGPGDYSWQQMADAITLASGVATSVEGTDPQAIVVYTTCPNAGDVSFAIGDDDPINLALVPELNTAPTSGGCAVLGVGKNDERIIEPLETIASAVVDCSCGTAVGDTSTAEYVNSDNETDATNGVGDVDGDGDTDDTKWSFDANEPDVEQVLTFTEDCLNDGGEVRWDWVNTDGDSGTQTFDADDWTRTGLNVQISNQATGSSGKIQRITATCTKAGDGETVHTCLSVYDACVEQALDNLCAKVDTLNEKVARQAQLVPYCRTVNGTAEAWIMALDCDGAILWDRALTDINPSADPLS